MSCVLSKSNFIGASFTYMSKRQHRDLNLTVTDQTLSDFITIINHTNFGSVFCLEGYVPLTCTLSVLLFLSFEIPLTLTLCL